MLIESIISALTSLVNPSEILKDELKRSETVIKLLKKFNLDPEQPAKEFAVVYGYALVEYGVGKPSTILNVFRQQEVKKAFKQAFDSNQPPLLFQEVEEFLTGHSLGQQLIAENLDWQRELAEFVGIFLTVAKRTRTPAEVLANQQLGSLHKKLTQLQQTLASLPTTESVQAAITQLITQSNLALPAASRHCQAVELGQQLLDWFETLGYGFEGYEVWEEEYFATIINVRAWRKNYRRILVMGIAGEAGIRDVNALQAAVTQQNTQDGWLVSARRVSQAARKEVEKEENNHLTCCTFDELLDEDANFTAYLDWLAEEVQRRSIDRFYVPLGCTKEEIDPESKQRLGVSCYGEEDGWIEGYVDLWLSDPAKEHLSVLGEFGTGKTWFALHYAWVALQKYQTAKQKGLPRPRLPLVIPLRDYANALKVESLFSEFFFHRYEIPLPSYSAFERLNRMGKLLLIFDGFDEMAARVDRQEMINNFWELAKVVVPGAKVILTCRTEHFPEARQGRALLNAELRSSVANLTAESPQFEVLELNKFNDKQIRQVFSFQAQPATVEQIMGNQQLLDLARRPVMTDLILEALPDIEKGKPVDMSRVYLYAVQRKMERDIKAERTFTSLADKLYFLCELSWEMLSTDQMSLNYRLFPDRIRELFDIKVQEEKDLDHWHYDMMGQTMLVRNSEGNYSPAHRSLLEFFVAYKLAAELGVLAEDFLDVVQQQSDLDREVAPQSYTWSEYFKRRRNSEGEIVPIARLREFCCESLGRLRGSLGLQPLAKAVWDLLVPMVDEEKVGRLLEVVEGTRGKTEKEVGYVGGNAATLLVKVDPSGLEGEDVSDCIVLGGDFVGANLRDVNFAQANLANSIFPQNFGTIFAIVFSPDGKLLATGDANCNVVLWEVATGKQSWLGQGHTDWVRSVTFDLTGKIIVSGSFDHTIKLWDVHSGECLATFRGHTSRVHSVAISPDNYTLASSSQDCTIKLWNLASGTCLYTLLGHTEAVRSLAFSPNGQLLASGDSNHQIKLWHLRTRECCRTLQGHDHSIKSVVFSQDGNILISGSDDQTVKLWNVETGECFQTLEGHTFSVRCVTISPNDTTIASGSYDKTVKLWDVKTGECLHTLQGHTNWVRCVAISSDSTTIASGGDDQSIRLWNSKTGECLQILQGYTGSVRGVEVCPDGRTIVSCSEDSIVRIWDFFSGKCLKTLQGHTSRVNDLAITPDGKVIVTSSYDKTIKLWNKLTGECLQTLQRHNRPVSSVDISCNGKLLVSGSADKTVKLWDLATGECLKTLQGHDDWVWSVAISPDGEYIVSSSGDRIVKIWEVSSGQCLSTLQTNVTCFNSVAINQDGQTLVMGNDDYTVSVWNFRTGKCLKNLQAHNKIVTTVTFSLNGQFIASGSVDRTIKLWDVETGKCLKTLTGHTNLIQSIAFNVDGKTLISGSNDETIKIWDIETGQCLKTLSNKPYANMNITGVKGLSTEEINSLKALGAVEKLYTATD
ncbi:MAG: NACHT domain-containing protein [Spirulinaceae cyanobacterium]